MTAKGLTIRKGMGSGVGKKITKTKPHARKGEGKKKVQTRSEGKNFCRVNCTIGLRPRANVESKVASNTFK